MARDHTGSGQAILELALTLPVFLALLALAVNGLLWGLAIALTADAASDAARAAIVHAAPPGRDLRSPEEAARAILRDRVSRTLAGAGAPSWAHISQVRVTSAPEGVEVEVLLHLGSFVLPDWRLPPIRIRGFARPARAGVGP